MTTLVTGTGAPVTVVAHGFGASLAETRSMLRGVPGTRVLPAARGHGSAPEVVTPGYAELAADLAGVADEYGATQALGVSMGAATILRLLSLAPDRFTRVVLFLPAAIDQARSVEAVRRSMALRDALVTRDDQAVVRAVRAELPSDLGPAADAYVAARSAFLLASPGLPGLLLALASDVPVVDRSMLGAVTAEVLVLAQKGDRWHPVGVARELAAALPHTRLVVFGAPGVLFRERARLRDLVVTHLTP